MRKIIQPWAGGLGDHMLLSTLARRIVESGDSAFMCMRTGSGEPLVRNPETADLVIALNPHLSGVVVDEPNCGFPTVDPLFENAQRYGSGIAGVEAHVGLMPPYSIYPDLYYVPKYRHEWSDVVIADPTSISQPIAAHVFDDFARHVCFWHGWDRNDVVVVRSQYAGTNGVDALAANRRYDLESIFELCDLIYSCKAFLVGESGAQSLAAAIKHWYRSTLPIFSNITTWTFNEMIYTYPNVRYKVTGRMQDTDYHPQG